MPYKFATPRHDAFVENNVEVSPRTDSSIKDFGKEYSFSNKKMKFKIKYVVFQSFKISFFVFPFLNSLSDPP